MTNMPKEIHDIYEPLEKDTIWLHAKWHLYRQLFGTDQKRIELLNEIAPVFFGACQDTMLDDVIISLARLTDPMKTGDRNSSRESLSLLRLVNSVDSKQYPELRIKVQKCWGQIDMTCKPFRTQVSRRIRHNDLATLKSSIDPLPGISRSIVEDALDNVRTLMNTILDYFDARTQSYKLVGPAGMDGEALIFHLEKLQKHNKKHGDV